MATGIKGNKEWTLHLGISNMPAFGFLECVSISRGLYLTDVVVKKAPIKVIASQPISSGKHVLLYFGDVASVEASHTEALSLSDGCILREIFIPGVHHDLVPFLDSIWEGEGKEILPEDAVGIVESTMLSGAIIAADRALKSADVRLCRLRLGQGIGGRAYFIVSGRQEEVEASLEAAVSQLLELDCLSRTDLIARPEPEAIAFF